MQSNTQILTLFEIIILMLISLISMHMALPSREPSNVGDFQWPAYHKAKGDHQLQCDNHAEGFLSIC
jgi:hypothetical protein